MDNQKNIILKLLQEVIFVTAAMRDKILGKIDQLSERQLELIASVLEDAKNTQKILIKERLKTHPELLTELKDYLAGEIKTGWHEAEKDNTQNEKSAMDNLEKELENII
ncbi:MAG: hypothetical protein WC285_01950 [Candidatus Gracilibacteria bacterium]|jgi:hypothetical protein